MNRETALTWSWLNVLNKKRVDALLSVYKNLDEALGAIDENMLTQLGCRNDTVINTLLRLEDFDVQAYEGELKKRKLEFLSFNDEAYPKALREIGDPPMFLYYQGDLSILDQPCIAVVGTREMTPYGKRVGEFFVPAFVSAGLVTVSGLAEGIDSVVAKETIHANGKTVAVLGHGLAEIFPKSNAVLAKDIVANGGLILSEFPLDIHGDKHTFPARNRIIAGLSIATVVLQAGEGSGALITADLALDYGRDVFAVPGEIFDPMHIGCHQLIAKGHGKLVTSPSDVLQELGIVVSASAPSRYDPQSIMEEIVLKQLSTMPQTVGDLAERSQVTIGDINATLTMLELSGAAKNVGNGRWVRS